MEVNGRRPIVKEKAGSEVAKEKGLGNRIVQLDGLRAFAFFAVFLNHAFSVPIMWAGVDLFFVLSGFLITGVLLREKERTNYFSAFYARRTFRILPPYLLFLLVLYLFFDRSWGDDWYVYVFFLSNVKDAFSATTQRVLDPLWSLALEEQFYLIWPLLVYRMRSSSLIRLCVCIIIGAPLFRICVGLLFGHFQPVYNLLPCRSDLLAMGALLAILREQHDRVFIRISKYGLFVSAMSVAIFLTLVIVEPDFRTSDNSPLFNSVGYSLVTLTMGGLVASAVGSSRGETLYKLLTVRPLVWLGTLSYSMYLYHVLILNELELAGIEGLTKAILTFIITWGLAVLSWKFFEAPLLRLKDKHYGYRYSGFQGK